jgi:hypothetical protein
LHDTLKKPLHESVRVFIFGSCFNLITSYFLKMISILGVYELI